MWDGQGQVGVRADDTPEQFDDVDTQLLRDYPELAPLMAAQDEPCCTHRDHGRGGCACPEHPQSAMHPFGS